MQIQTHALIGAWPFGRRDPALMLAGAIAGAAPDVPMFVIMLALEDQIGFDSDLVEAPRSIAYDNDARTGPE